MNAQKNGLDKLIKIVAILISFYLLYSFRIVVVNGGSMEDTLHNRQILIGYFCKSHLRIDRGDIVIFIKETKEHGSLLKRVVGIAGDTIELMDNELYLNGDKVQEDYIKEDMSVNADGLKYTVPSNSIFVMGDNRNNSLDSRDKSVNYINIDTELVGKVVIDLEKFGITYKLIRTCAITILLVVILGLTVYIITCLRESKKND